jgi:hypothetical protein
MSIFTIYRRICLNFEFGSCLAAHHKLCFVNVISNQIFVLREIIQEISSSVDSDMVYRLSSSSGVQTQLTTAYRWTDEGYQQMSS